MSKIKNGGLNQYGAGPFKHQQFGTAGVEGVKRAFTSVAPSSPWTTSLLCDTFTSICMAFHYPVRPFHIRAPSIRPAVKTRQDVFDSRANTHCIRALL